MVKCYEYSYGRLQVIKPEVQCLYCSYRRRLVHHQLRLLRRQKRNHNAEQWVEQQPDKWPDLRRQEESNMKYVSTMITWFSHEHTTGRSSALAN